MKRLLLMLLVALPMMIKASETNKLQVVSPNENVRLQFWLDETGRPTYEMTFKNRPVVLPSHLGLVLAKDKHASKGMDETDLMDGFTIEDVATAEADETWEPVWGETKTIRNHYRQLTVTLQQVKITERTEYQGNGNDRGLARIEERHVRKMDLVFRVFDDGIGFRCDFPQQQELNYEISTLIIQSGRR